MRLRAYRVQVVSQTSDGRYHATQEVICDHQADRKVIELCGHTVSTLSDNVDVKRWLLQVEKQDAKADGGRYVCDETAWEPIPEWTRGTWSTVSETT